MISPFPLSGFCKHCAEPIVLLPMGILIPGSNAWDDLVLVHWKTGYGRCRDRATGELAKTVAEWAITHTVPAAQPKEQDGCSMYYNLVEPTKVKDHGVCGCCNQFCPHPTHPGIWEFDERAWRRESDGSEHWRRVLVVSGESVAHPDADQDMLMIFPIGETEPYRYHALDWPEECVWRKVTDDPVEIDKYTQLVKMGLK